MERTKEEIYEQIDAAVQAQIDGSKFPGMSYEEGVDAALRWALGDQEDPPMAD